MLSIGITSNAFKNIYKQTPNKIKLLLYSLNPCKSKEMPLFYIVSIRANLWKPL